jgi:hypothetical protein
LCIIHSVRLYGSDIHLVELPCGRYLTSRHITNPEPCQTYCNRVSTHASTASVFRLMAAAVRRTAWRSGLRPPSLRDDRIVVASDFRHPLGPPSQFAVDAVLLCAPVAGCQLLTWRCHQESQLYSASCHCRWGPFIPTSAVIRACGHDCAELSLIGIAGRWANRRASTGQTVMHTADSLRKDITVAYIGQVYH